MIRYGPNYFVVHGKSCTFTLSKKGCFMSSSFKKHSKLHQGCLKIKCVWVLLMPKIQCWILSHVTRLLVTRWEILALERSIRGNSQIYTQFSSFWPRDTLNSASAVRTTAGICTRTYNVNCKFTICACHLALCFHTNRCEENFPKLIRG